VRLGFGLSLAQCLALGAVERASRVIGQGIDLVAVGVEELLSALSLFGRALVAALALGVLAWGLFGHR
jgi:hypothetical protein